MKAKTGTRPVRISNKLLFTVHGWIGMQLGLLLFLVLFTGTLATLAHEIDWLITPAQRVQPLPKQAGWPALIRAGVAARHDAQPLYMTAGAGPRFAHELVVQTPAGELRRVFVDPYTATVTGEGAWFSVQRFLRDFHRWLFLPKVGIYLVSALAVPLLLSMITALVFYKKWWRGFFRLRRGLGRRVFWSDLHRLTGVWSLWFVLVIGVTGVWYLAEKLLANTGNLLRDTPPPLVRVEEARLAERGPALPLPDYAGLVRAAREAYPALEIRGVIFPQRVGEPIVFGGQADAWLVRDRANRVELDPYSGEVLRVQRAERLPALYYWLHMADPLHFGDFAGLLSKVIWFVFGLGLSGLVLTGSYLGFKRAMTAADPARARSERSKPYRISASRPAVGSAAPEYPR